MSAIAGVAILNQCEYMHGACTHSHTAMSLAEQSAVHAQHKIEVQALIKCD